MIVEFNASILACLKKILEKKLKFHGFLFVQMLGLIQILQKILKHTLEPSEALLEFLESSLEMRVSLPCKKPLEN